jgi:transketolase
MQIIAPCDPAECAEATRWCARQSTGPVYLRIGKAGEPVLTKGAEPWRCGRLRYLTRGRDVCILTYGCIAKMAAEVAGRLEAQGRSVSLVSVHTVKPLDCDGIAEALRRHAHVIVIEEHAPHGGLAAQTKQIAWDVKAGCRLDAFTLRDQFIHNYGSWDNLLDSHGLSTERILAHVA